MSGGYGFLDFVDEAGDSVDGIVLWPEPELGHREEVVFLNVGVDAFGNDFFE
jgi:hypothetical protein